MRPCFLCEHSVRGRGGVAIGRLNCIDCGNKPWVIGSEYKKNWKFCGDRLWAILITVIIGGAAILGALYGAG